MPTISPKQISDKPEVWLIQVPNEGFEHHPPPECFDFFAKLNPRLFMGQFRAVSINRLPTILKTGIDVEPSDSVIYADYFEKAWEYGEWPKVVLALDQRKLQKTFREIPSDTAPHELAALRQTYPTAILSKDGTMLWLSRLREDDPRLASGYEIAYAWWLEGNPFDALKGIFIFWRSQDVDVLNKHASLR